MPAIEGHFDVPQQQPVPEIDQQLNTLTSSEAYRDPRHVDHRAVVDAATKLFQRKYGGAEQDGTTEDGREYLRQMGVEMPPEASDDIKKAMAAADPDGQAGREVTERLSVEWGAGWEQRLEGYREMASQLDQACGGGLAEFLEETQLGLNIDVIRAFDEVRRRISNNPTPAEARKFIDAIMHSKAYMSPQYRGLRDSLVAAVSELMKIVYPEPGSSQRDDQTYWQARAGGRA